MYRRATSTSNSLRRFLVVCAVLLLGAAKEGYGQRVYADVEQNDATVPASVINESNAIMNNGGDTSIYSTLNVTVGALGLISAKQNLQFDNVVNPTPSTPVMVKFSTPGSLLDLLGGFSVQRTNNANSTLVAPSYGGTGLLELLNLFGGGKTAILKIPPTGALFDGVRLTINTAILGIARTANYYYAFYIAPSEIPSTVTACENIPIDVTISNYDEAIEDQGYPYTYQLYTDSLTGDPIENISFSNGILTLPDTLSAKEYYLEARENGIYPSARTKITLIRNEPPSISLTTTTLSVCQEDNSVDLSYTGVANTPISYTIDWDALAEAAGFIDIANALHAFSSDGGEISVSIPPDAEEGSYEGILTIKNANGCTSTAYPISVNVLPKPAAPNLNIDPHSQY